MDKKSDLIFVVLIIAFIAYMIMGSFTRKTKEHKLENNGVYIAAEIYKINFGTGSAQIEYVFNFQGKTYRRKDICNFEEVVLMEVGDIYLCKFNLNLDFSKLNCACKIDSKLKEKLWDSEPNLCK